MIFPSPGVKGGVAGSWRHAARPPAYELDELGEGLQDAATFHPTHKDSPLPVSALIEKIMTEPVGRLEKAVAARDATGFTPAFDALTDACNSCHRATNFGFNVVTRPNMNPYSNQVFQQTP